MIFYITDQSKFTASFELRCGKKAMSQSRLRIVTVADNDFAQTILELFVASHDDFILVGKAHDNAAVVEVAKQSQPDILLMDLNLLTRNGIDTIRQLKLQNSQLRIILLTDEQEPERLDAALKAGADVYLPQLTLSTKLAETIQMVSQLT